jgi:copper resistance protein B
MKLNKRTTLVFVIAMAAGLSAARAQDRDPRGFSADHGLGPVPGAHVMDEASFGSLLVNRLEAVHTRGNGFSAYDLQGWYGRDYDRAVLKAQGDIDGGKSEDARTELLWSHAIAAYWNGQLGLRHDSGSGQRDRTFAALGIQGLAPYWFELDTTAYVGEQGRTALRFEAQYELLFTQRLILQSRLEANLYGKRDEGRRLGSGLSDLWVGMRLRYEFRREFAPYVGIEWGGKYGGTADRARAAGLDANELRTVVGLRFWF